MNRCKFGGVLLILLLGLSLLSTHAVRSCHEPLSADLRQASDAALAGDWNRAEALVSNVQTNWESWWSWGAALSDHAPMEAIDGQLAQLRVYLRARESTAAAALCADLARQMEAMADAHILNLRNLL